MEERLKEHNSNKVKSTKSFSPFEMVYTKQFETENEAREYEHKIKDCRKEKERILSTLI